ncbi:MAG TPA: alpha/beta fold hydrolase [Gemmatimonadales bacterium]|jgi:homoserine O-acetyltransferase
MTPALLGVALVALPPLSQARAPFDSATVVIEGFHFASGDTLSQVRLFYHTMGHARKDASGKVRNAVLILHGTGGSGGQFHNPAFTELYAHGAPLDTGTMYVILPDNLGHGRSGKPSDGLRAAFPRYDYQDMVALQYRLVTEVLRVDHLRLVMGTSMGCMHAWMWAERWPDFMDGVVPLACLPTQIAGRNRMMRRMIIDDIRNDPAWKRGAYTEQPPGLKAALQVLFLMGSSPQQLQKSAPTRDAADSAIEQWIAQRAATTDANDMLYQFDASRDYDPAPDLERITAPVLAINSADDMINPPELGIMERLIRRIHNGRYVVVPTSEITRGHGTHTVAAAWRLWFDPFVASLPAR